MNQHVLFVDDEVPVRETLSIYFKMKGIAVTSADNGADALRFAGETPFSLVILDVDLGGENGLDVLSKFKSAHPELPVVMFTSLGNDPDLQAQARANGADGFLSKTESLDTLLKEVQRLVA